ncbi:hypothetical protein RUMHYD_03598, partial [Blautia hydrogenotrophica DSM 10507]
CLSCKSFAGLIIARFPFCMTFSIPRIFQIYDSVKRKLNIMMRKKDSDQLFQKNGRAPFVR